MNNYDKTYSNTSQTHPLQFNSQDYFTYYKYVSIHSEDRDILAYPNSSEFEIELPEDIINISSMKLIDWAFPSNYDTFSILNNNITMYFKINNPYNPYLNNVDDEILGLIYNALTEYNNTLLYNDINQSKGYYEVTIQEGFYNPLQLVTELTNKFNDVVTRVIISYLIRNNYYSELEEFKKTGYTRFVIVYNSVLQKIWFGNRSDSFTLLNEFTFAINSPDQNVFCKKNQLPDFSNWGLPSNLGLIRENETSIPPEDINYNYVRFYFSDILFSGDKGYWLTPIEDVSGNAYPGAIVQYIESPNKINIFGPSYIYMEIFKYNSIDETVPYNINSFTLTTNETNGIVNSAFAKLPVISTPLTQFYDGPARAYKFFSPPIERIRKLKFKFRYHNGVLVDFSTFPYSFTLEFTILLPMINRSIKYVNGS